jgi:hypothetical protein
VPLVESCSPLGLLVHAVLVTAHVFEAAAPTRSSTSAGIAVPAPAPRRSPRAPARATLRCLQSRRRAGRGWWRMTDLGEPVRDRLPVAEQLRIGRHAEMGDARNRQRSAPPLETTASGEGITRPSKDEVRQTGGSGEARCWWSRRESNPRPLECHPGGWRLPEDQRAAGVRVSGISGSSPATRRDRLRVQVAPPQHAPFSVRDTELRGAAPRAAVAKDQGLVAASVDPLVGPFAHRGQHREQRRADRRSGVEGHHAQGLRNRLAPGDVRSLPSGSCRLPADGGARQGNVPGDGRQRPCAETAANIRMPLPWADDGCSVRP